LGGLGTGLLQWCDSGEQQDDLVDTLEQRYGTMSHSPELIRDCVSEEGMSVTGDDDRKQEGKKWKKGNET